MIWIGLRPEHDGICWRNIGDCSSIPMPMYEIWPTEGPHRRNKFLTTESDEMKRWWGWCERQLIYQPEMRTRAKGAIVANRRVRTKATSGWAGRWFLVHFIRQRRIITDRGNIVRKTKVVTIDFGERDRGKQFLISEMSASQAEKWGVRLLGAMTRAGVEIPDGAFSAGMNVLLMIGLQSAVKSSYADLEPLLDEMMTCVQFIPDPSKPAIIRVLAETDIEDVATRAFLRSEVVELHVGFSFAAWLLKFGASLAAARISRDASTSRKRSRRSSQAD